MSSSSVACFIGSQNSSLDWHAHGTEFSSALQISLTAVYSVTFITALLGNILLIHIIRQRRPLSAVSILIVNMAASDLLAALFTIPYSVAYFYVQSHWFGGIAGTISCKVVHFVIGTTISSSIFTLLAISVERYIGVVKPVLYPSFIKHPALLSIAIWLSSVSYMGVFLYVYRVAKDHNGVSHCFADWEPLSRTELSPKIFYSSVAIVLYILPLFIIAILSTLIIRKLEAQKISVNGYLSTTHALNFQNRNHYVMRMLLVIVMLFAVCWLPVHVLHLLMYFYPDIYNSLPLPVPLLLFWISHANSALNPCVVIILNGSFRKTFVDMVRCLCCYQRIGANRVSCGNYGSSPLLVARRQGGITLYHSVRWSKQDHSSPVTLLDIRKIPQDN